MLGNDSLALEVQEVNYCGLLDQISFWKTFHDCGTFGFLFPFVFTLFFSQVNYYSLLMTTYIQPITHSEPEPLPRRTKRKCFYEVMHSNICNMGPQPVPTCAVWDTEGGGRHRSPILVLGRRELPRGLELRVTDCRDTRDALPCIFNLFFSLPIFYLPISYWDFKLIRTWIN